MLLTNLNRENLLAPLGTVTGIVEKRHTLPILSNVLISSSNKLLTLLSTDLEIQIQASTHIETQQDFAITVNAKKLFDILRALPANIPVQIDTDDQRITIRSGKSRFNLQSLAADDFPKLALDSEKKPSITIAQNTLKNLLAKVQYAMGNQDIRYYLNGLFISTEGNSIKLVATDGHRLAFIEQEIDSNVEKSDIIVPRKTILELYKLLNQTDEPVTIEIGKNQVIFSLNNIVIHSKVIDGKFPDYTRVIPTTNQKIVAIKRELFLQALQRAAILLSDKFRGVRVLLEDGLLKIICNNSEQEEAEEELEIAYQGEKLDLGFNINYLLDILTHTETDDLLLAFGDQATSSTLITLPDNPHFKYVVMPMRI